MPLDYEIDGKGKVLVPVIDDYAHWFSQFTRRVFYANEFSMDDRLEAPENFSAWLDTARADDFFQEAALNQLERVHRDMTVLADDLAAAAMQGNKPGADKYGTFIGLYDSFIQQLRHIEQDCIFADFGIDPPSGLRNRKAMVRDMERELERRSRRGRPFCVALAHIDNYDMIADVADEAQLREVIGTIGRLIRACLRSFDDAYRSEGNEFVVSLKHSDTAGGMVVFNRLRNMIQREKVSISGADGTEIPLTMSYCVAEPLPGDTLDDLMKHMRSDLAEYRDEGDKGVEYHEQSPLQRYIKSQE